MPREMLKFRPGDVGLKIKKDGQMEVAGVNEESPMIDQTGKVNPALLFAAAWARKDQKTFEALVQNFKDAVSEGYFGDAAKNDNQRALDLQKEKEATPSSMKEVPVAESDSASGAVTFEQPMTVEEHLDRRDS